MSDDAAARRLALLSSVSQDATVSGRVVVILTKPMSSGEESGSPERDRTGWSQTATGHCSTVTHNHGPLLRAGRPAQGPPSDGTPLLILPKAPQFYMVRSYAFSPPGVP